MLTFVLTEYPILRLINLRYICLLNNCSDFMFYWKILGHCFNRQRSLMLLIV